MPDWDSTHQRIFEAQVFHAILYCMFGVAVHDFIITLKFDFEVVTGRRKWKWSMLLFFCCRYVLLTSMVFITAVAQPINPKVSCQAALTASIVISEIALWFASTIYAFRVYAVSGGSKRVGGIMLLCLLVQGGLSLWSSPQLEFAHSPILGCYTTKIPAAFVSPFGAQLFTDTIAFAMLLYFILKAHRGVPLRTLATNLILQGAIYYAIAVICHVSSIVLMGLRLNIGTQIVSLPYAVVLPCVCATRAFRSLLENGAEQLIVSISHGSGGKRGRGTSGNLTTNHDLPDLGYHQSSSHLPLTSLSQPQPHPRNSYHGDQASTLRPQTPSEAVLRSVKSVEHFYEDRPTTSNSARSNRAPPSSFSNKLDCYGRPTSSNSLNGQSGGAREYRNGRFSSVHDPHDEEFHSISLSVGTGDIRPTSSHSTRSERSIKNIRERAKSNALKVDASLMTRQSEESDFSKTTKFESVDSREKDEKDGIADSDDGEVLSSAPPFSTKGWTTSI